MVWRWRKAEDTDGKFKMGNEEIDIVKEEKTWE